MTVYRRETGKFAEAKGGGTLSASIDLSDGFSALPMAVILVGEITYGSIGMAGERIAIRSPAFSHLLTALSTARPAFSAGPAGSTAFLTF